MVFDYSWIAIWICVVVQLFYHVLILIYKSLNYNNRESISSLARVLRKRDEFEEANKKRVPQWWFMLILVVALILSILNSLVYGHELELPVWTILLAVLLAALLLVPITVVLATAGMVLLSYSLTNYSITK